jgi:hypothetical protein
MRFAGIVLCDALLKGCQGEIALDNADDWFIGAHTRGGFGALLVVWGYEDVCPSCAGKLAFVAPEHDLNAGGATS